MDSRDYEVVIVGAGFAGAAAAAALAGAKFKCLILEACDRVGGRAYTRNFAVAGEMRVVLRMEQRHQRCGHRAVPSEHGIEIVARIGDADR